MQSLSGLFQDPFEGYLDYTEKLDDLETTYTSCQQATDRKVLKTCYQTFNQISETLEENQLPKNNLKHLIVFVDQAYKKFENKVTHPLTRMAILFKWLMRKEKYLTDYNLTEVTKQYNNLRLTIFIRAIQGGYLEIVETLLKDKGFNPAAGNNCAIKWASACGNLAILQALLKDSRVNPAANNNAAIQNASLNGHVEVVKTLLKDPRVNPAAASNAALQEASLNGQIEVVKTLLNNPSVKLEAQYGQAFKNAIQKSHIEIIKMFLADKTIYSEDAYHTAFKEASLSGRVEVVKILLEDREGVLNEDDYKLSLRMAILGDHVEVVKALLETKKVHFAVDYDMAIQLASHSQQHLEIIQLLETYKKRIESDK